MTEGEKALLAGRMRCGPYKDKEGPNTKDNYADQTAKDDRDPFLRKTQAGMTEGETSGMTEGEKTMTEGEKARMTEGEKARMTEREKMARFLGRMRCGPYNKRREEEPLRSPSRFGGGGLG